MATIHLPPLSPIQNEETKVFLWRKSRFEALGLTPANASIAALIPPSKLDLHKVEKLVNAGCNPTTAIWISKEE